MALDSSELNWRQVLRYVNTHIIFIPIQVELIRSMPETHPIYALLNYHLYGDLAIEYLGNKVLFSLGTNYDKVGAFGATGFLRAILDELSRSSVIRDYPAEIEERGLKHLPRSRYVKYGAKYYDIFKTFVTAYVHTYYPLKRSIQTDSELQTGASRCSALQGINDFPSSFQGFDDLIKIVTNFIFQSAVRHHFMNGRVSWATIAAPFSPAALYNVLLPTTKGVAVNPMDYAIPSDLFPTLCYLASGFYRPIPAPVTLLKAYATIPFSQEKNLLVPIAAFQLAMKGMELEVTLSESDEDYLFNVVKHRFYPGFRSSKNLPVDIFLHVWAYFLYTWTTSAKYYQLNPKMNVRSAKQRRRWFLIMSLNKRKLTDFSFQSTPQRVVQMTKAVQLHGEALDISFTSVHV